MERTPTQNKAIIEKLSNSIRTYVKAVKSLSSDVESSKQVIKEKDHQLTLKREREESLEQEVERLKKELKSKEEESLLQENKRLKMELDEKKENLRKDSEKIADLEYGSTNLTTMYDFLSDIICYHALHFKSRKKLQTAQEGLYNCIINLHSVPHLHFTQALDMIISFFDDYKVKPLDDCPVINDLSDVMTCKERTMICFFEEILKRNPSTTEIFIKLCEKLKTVVLSRTTLGSFSQCRIHAAVCKLLNLPDLSWQLCTEAIVKKSIQGLYFAAFIGSIYPEALLSHFNSGNKGDIESRTMIYFLQQKPSALTEKSWIWIQHVFRCKCQLSSPAIKRDSIICDINHYLYHKEECPHHAISNEIALGLILNHGTVHMEEDSLELSQVNTSAM